MSSSAPCSDAILNLSAPPAAAITRAPSRLPTSTAASPTPPPAPVTRSVSPHCHGPGSAHVKAGGGRGVGGIISFRPEGQSRTAEENNAICLTCHERGDRTYWNG